MGGMNSYLANVLERAGYPSEYRQYDTQYQGAKECVGWMWWDTNQYTSAATTQLRYFNALRANLSLSNMEVAGQLSAPKAFFLRAILVKPLLPTFVTTAAADGNTQTGAVNDMEQLLHTGVLQLQIGQKIYGQWPLWKLSAGGGVVPFYQTGDVDVVVQTANNGICDSRSVYTLTKPLFIAPQINFQIDLIWPAALTLDVGNQNIWVGLDGDLVRPVQ